MANMAGSVKSDMFRCRGHTILGNLVRHISLSLNQTNQAKKSVPTLILSIVKTAHKKR